jgi:dolichyl-phosphate beta-glucosyltransferase
LNAALPTSAADVLLVIPCYRESGRIGAFLDELAKRMTALGGVRIRVVEDGSDPEEQQRMRAVIDAQRARHACVLEPLFLPKNLGKGGAIYAAWNAEREASWLAFVDADGSCPAAEVERLIMQARFSPPRTAIIASRVKMLGRVVERDWRRHVIGRVYATLVSNMLNIAVYDSQCGLKLVPRPDFEGVSAKLRVTGFAFDVELITALMDSGCAVREEPISWHETPGGKVRLVRDSLRMARDVWQVRRARAQ